MKIVGIKEVNYVSKKTGKEVRGYEFQGIYPSKRCIYGHAVGTDYISEYALENSGGALPQVGDEVTVLYNRNGQVTSFAITSHNE